MRSFDCAGTATSEGTGFLVGGRVVMTARHLVKGSCSVKVKSGSRWLGVDRWTFWRSGTRGDGSVEDLATLKLQSSAGGHVFKIRTSSPPAGTNLAAIGHPLGNELSVTQGRIVQKAHRYGIPLIAVRLLGAEGASGSPLVDDAGNVVGILQLGLGAKDVLGQSTAGVVVGIDLSSWWAGGARHDLCHAYPKGDIPGCLASDVASQRAGEPKAASLQELEKLATSAGYPVYWAGLQPEGTYELTQTRLGVYIRYLPKGVRVGDNPGKYLIVATYPMKDGFTALQAVAARKGAIVTRLPRGGLAVAAGGKTTDVYLSYPGAAYQVEVYDPTPGRARSLIEAGRVRPIAG